MNCKPLSRNHFPATRPTTDSFFRTPRSLLRCPGCPISAIDQGEPHPPRHHPV